jgi:hypothetical protein
MGHAVGESDPVLPNLGVCVDTKSRQRGNRPDNPVGNGLLFDDTDVHNHPAVRLNGSNQGGHHRSDGLDQIGNIRQPGDYLVCH